MFAEVKDIGEFADMNSRQHGGLGFLRVKKDGKKIRIVVIFITQYDNKHLKVKIIL